MALESKALRMEAERARLFDHSTNRGTESELAILRWLRARFATEYSVSSGEIIDSFGTDSDLKSRQQDGIVHRATADAARFLLPSGMRLVPIETVAAVVEVKLTLTKEEFQRADKAAQETARLRLRPGRYGHFLQRSESENRTVQDIEVEDIGAGLPTCHPSFGSPPVLFSLFAFGGIEQLDTLKDWMRNSTISMVCCLSAGCVVRGGHRRSADVKVGPPDGIIATNAEEALWHFSETLFNTTKRHSLILDHLQPDFTGYAPYGETIQVDPEMDLGDE